MKIPQLIRAEFARLWATPMARIAFVALMCVPLLYGGLYLWANQDPYARLDQVPVALVVADEGVQHGDEVRSIGDDVAENLIEDGSFDWHRVSEANAEQGVEGGAYDFSVTIPKDFTASLESSQTDDPRQAEVILTTNDANSYLASTIGEQAVKQIREQVVRSVNQEAAKTMLDGIAEIRVSLWMRATGPRSSPTGRRPRRTAPTSSPRVRRRRTTVPVSSRAASSRCATAPATCRRRPSSWRTAPRRSRRATQRSPSSGARWPGRVSRRPTGWPPIAMRC